MRSLRTLVQQPTPAILREWRAELLTAAVLLGGVVSMLAG